MGILKLTIRRARRQDQQTNRGNLQTMFNADVKKWPAKNLKVTLSIALLSCFSNSNGLPELQMNLPSFMGCFNYSVFSVYVLVRTLIT